MKYSAALVLALLASTSPFSITTAFATEGTWAIGSVPANLLPPEPVIPPAPEFVPFVYSVPAPVFVPVVAVAGADSRNTAALQQQAYEKFQIERQQYEVNKNAAEAAHYESQANLLQKYEEDKAATLKNYQDAVEEATIAYFEKSATPALEHQDTQNFDADTQAGLNNMTGNVAGGEQDTVIRINDGAALGTTNSNVAGDTIIRINDGAALGTTNPNGVGGGSSQNITDSLPPAGGLSNYYAPGSVTSGGAQTSTGGLSNYYSQNGSTVTSQQPSTNVANAPQTATGTATTVTPNNSQNVRTGIPAQNIRNNVVATNPNVVNATNSTRSTQRVVLATGGVQQPNVSNNGNSSSGIRYISDYSDEQYKAHRFER